MEKEFFVNTIENSSNKVAFFRVQNFFVFQSKFYLLKILFQIKINYVLLKNKSYFLK